MELQQFIEIMSDEDDEYSGKGLSEPGCNTMKGLLIIHKYLPLSGISGSGYEVIYACDAEELVNAGLTKEDAIELRRQNWMLEDEEYLACFV